MHFKIVDYRRWLFQISSILCPQARSALTSRSGHTLRPNVSGKSIRGDKS